MGEIDGVLRAWGIPRGGTGAVSEAIASAARSFGAEIRTETPVERILTRGDEVIGAVTSSGEEVIGRVTLSSLDPRQTFVRLVQPDLLDRSFLEEVERYRYRGSSGKVNLALDGLPEFTCLPGDGEHLRGAISFSPSIDYMELAYDDAKAGRFSRRPYIDMIIPTLVDPSMAPPGKHVMSCFVQYAPYHLADGDEWDDARREAFAETVLDTIEERAPNIRKLILHAQVLTPKDIEDRFGLSEGNIFQGELSLEQLFFNRPVAGWARYRTPLRNLWMCGSATHPGGGIMGASGRLAALQVVRSLRIAQGGLRPSWPGSNTTQSSSVPATTAWWRPGTWRRRDCARSFSNAATVQAAHSRPRRLLRACERRLPPTASEVCVPASCESSGSNRTAFETSSPTWSPSPRPPTGRLSRCGATRLGPRTSSGLDGRVTPRHFSRSTARSALSSGSCAASRRPSRRTSRLRLPPTASRASHC